jgi:hypothetical protein
MWCALIVIESVLGVEIYNMLKFDFFYGVAAFILGVLCGTYLCERQTPPPPLPIHTYIIYPNGPTGPKVSTKGTSIRAVGLCVELSLHGRVDTIFCGNQLTVTEGEEPKEDGIPG